MMSERFDETYTEPESVETEEPMEKIPPSPLKPLRDDNSELKGPFDQVRNDLDAKLKKCNERILTTKKLYLATVDMTKTVKDKHVSASVEEKEWRDIKIKLANTLFKNMVRLNVGGERYTTTVGTLTRGTGTYFTEIFAGQWQLQLDDLDKSIFIDRNGATFAYVLEYLRTDTVADDVLKDELLRHRMIVEAKYFRLSDLTKILTDAEVIHAETARIAKTFPNGTLLGIEQIKKLNEFYGKPDQAWTLIHKASRDGFDAASFHNRCKNQGPTFTIIRSSTNWIFGGYTAVAWTSDGNYKNDATAFLFTLANSHDIPPTKYLVNPGNASHAVLHSASYGPYFGSTAIGVSNSSNTSNSTIGFPNCYVDSTGKGNVTFTGSTTFLVADMEVFKLGWIFTFSSQVPPYQIRLINLMKKVHCFERRYKRGFIFVKSCSAIIYIETYLFYSEQWHKRAVIFMNKLIR